jgi:hypothetical protein
LECRGEYANAVFGGMGAHASQIARALKARGGIQAGRCFFQILAAQQQDMLLNPQNGGTGCSCNTNLLAAQYWRWPWPG